MSAIKKLFFGEIIPFERGLEPETDEVRRLDEFVSREKAFTAALTPEQRQEYADLSDAQQELANATELAAFVEGFRLGMQLTVEGMRNNRGGC